MEQLSIPRSNAWLEKRDWQDGKRDKSVMDRLYDQMDGSYPNVWRANFKSPQAIANWASAWSEAFEDEGITPRDIAQGIKASRRLYDMPPSLPQFLKACRPDISMGIEAQFHRAVSEMTKRRKHQPQTWPTPGLFWAAAHIGPDLLVMDYRPLAGRWTAAMAEHGHRTDPIPDVTPERALSAPVMTKEEAAARVGQLKARKIGGSNGGIGWAMKVAEDCKAGVYKGGAHGAKIAAEALRDANRLPEHMEKYLPKKLQAEDEQQDLREAA